MYKHYIRKDANGYIIKGFSDAFEEPLETDICINSKGGRQFELLNEVNPPLTNMDRCHLYKYVDGKIIETTQAEQDAELATFPVPVVKLSVEEELTATKEELAQATLKINTQQTVIDAITQDFLPSIIEMLG